VSVGIASLLSSVLMSGMYVLFLRHPSEKEETKARKESIAERIVKVSEPEDVSENTKELDIKMNENGTMKKRRTNREDSSADQNSTKASTAIPTTTAPSKEVWYIQIMNGVRNTKFSCIITLKCVLLFVANTLSYFVAKGIQDWIGNAQFFILIVKFCRYLFRIIPSQMRLLSPLLM